MDKRWFILPAVAMLALTGCDGTDPDEEEFVATLSGNNEVPVRNTTASGTAEFVVAEDESEVEFTIDVSNIFNVSAAHIHGSSTGSTTTNSGVIVTLFSPSSPTGPVSGRLVTGSFTEADDPQAVPMDSVLEWMRTGRAYVNVHTNDGVAPGSTGPGDFGGGEIRGQIMPD